MWFASVYAGYLGFQWRRVRTTQEEITALKATLPVKEAVTANGDVEPVALSPRRRRRGED